MKAEEYFDSIYTYHTNEFVRMPLSELHELMENYASIKCKELEEKNNMAVALLQNSQPIWEHNSPLTKSWYEAKKKLTSKTK